MASGRKDIHKDAKHFQKGDPRINRAGRPKQLPALKEMLDEVLGDKVKGITAAQAILMRLRAEATKGNMRAIEILFGYAYGRPKQQIDLDSSGHVQMEVTVKLNADDLRSDPIE